MSGFHLVSAMCELGCERALALDATWDVAAPPLPRLSKHIQELEALEHQMVSLATKGTGTLCLWGAAATAADDEGTEGADACVAATMARPDRGLI